MKTFVFMVSLGLTAFFLNHKFSKAVRVIAFNENEPLKDAYQSIILMALCVIAWTIFYAI